MARKRFDSSLAKGAAPAGESPSPALPQRGREQRARRERKGEMTVSQVAAMIQGTLESHIPRSLKVIGEVSNLSARGHWYFSLKDAEAVLSCVAWQSTVRKLKTVWKSEPRDGDEVVVTGHVSHYAPQGRTQFYVTNMKPVGAGALEQRFQAMCAELRGLGYFDEDRKQGLPWFPRKIAVITSKTSAAMQDVLDTKRRRCAAVGLVLVDVRVQGEAAKDEVARAIGWVDAHHEALGVEAILVTRGGGSMEDLWAFNERVVADAAYKCSIPLVAAIGHESDTTVIELVADRRAATPTQAVMMLVPDGDDLSRQVDHLSHRLHQLVRREVDRKRERLKTIEMHAMFRDPKGIILLARDRVAGLGDLLQRATERRILGGRDRLRGLERHLRAVDPMRVLERGYSLTEKADGSLVRSVDDVEGGDQLVTVVADGSVHSVVDGPRPRNPRKPQKPKKQNVKGQRKSHPSPNRGESGGSQFDLFGDAK